MGDGNRIPCKTTDLVRGIIVIRIGRLKAFYASIPCGALYYAINTVLVFHILHVLALSFS